MAAPQRTGGAESGRPTVASVLANTLLLWLATAIAGIGLWPIYESPQLIVAVGGALVAGTAVAVAGAAWRWPAPVVALGTVLGIVLLGVPLAIPDRALYGVLPTPDGLIALLATLALGWKQLLTISLPVGTYQGLLVPFFALTLVLTVIALSAALRSPRGGLAVFGPVLLLATALMFGPAREFFPLALGLALLGTSLIWLAVRRELRRRTAVRRSLDAGVLASAGTGGPPAVSPEEDADADTIPPRGAIVVPQAPPRRVHGSTVRRDRRAHGLHTAVSGLVILTLAGAAATGAAALLPPTAERSVLRNAVEQPFDPRSYSSPLSGFRTYWQGATPSAVMLTATGLRGGDRLRIATLDSYDGIVYSVGSAADNPASGLFARVPSAIDQDAVDGRDATVTIEVSSLTGPWLPTVGLLEDIDFSGSAAASLRDSFYYNATTGTAAVIGGVSVGDRYTLTARVPAEPGRDELAGLTPGTAVVPAPSRVPDEVSAAVDRYTTGISAPGEQLAAVLDGLLRDGYVSHGVGDDAVPSRSGHAADRVSELLDSQPMVGDAEQYAVTAALMARELGFPARVVLGFVAGDDAGDGRQAVDIRGDQVSAWIEVNTGQAGWITLDPNPEPRDIPDDQPDEPTRVSRPQSIVPPPLSEPSTADRQMAPESERDEPDAQDPTTTNLLALLRVTGIGALVLALALSPFFAIIAAKALRRRRRRRSRTSRDRIRGGWSEFEDTAVDHGFQLPRSATRSEVAAVVGGTQSAVLAAVTDRAVFAPTDPDAVEADHVWRAVDELRASLDADLGPWQRLKARISRKSLSGYSGSNRSGK